MKVYEVEASSEDELWLSVIRRDIVAYWESFDCCEDSGGTTRDELERIRHSVTDCLNRGQPKDIHQAFRLTAEAEYKRACGDQ